MSTEIRRIKKVSVWAHPMVVVIMAAVLVLTGVILSFSAHASPAGIRRSLLVGLEIWVPYFIYFKWAYRKNIGFYAAIAAKGYLRMTIAEQMRHLIITLPPILVLFMVLPWLTQGGRMSPHPMVAVFGILCIVIYPEQKAIYRAAQAIVAQSQGDHGIAGLDVTEGDSNSEV